ncbi:hypothetical protein [Chryseobacterium indoltheticum]|uniref:hypothetical protein n=1 Tax=Chryseobacterium indoltheticum TaxID=254 RepID=UPI0037421E17
MTYIQIKEGFLELTTIIDLYDRKIFGWSLSNGMSTEETSIITRPIIRMMMVKWSLFR